MTRRYLYRQDIATMLDVSVRQVMNNEQRWGLTQHKEQLNARVIRYKAQPAIESLKQYFRDVALVS